MDTYDLTCFHPKLYEMLLQMTPDHLEPSRSNSKCTGAQISRISTWAAAWWLFQDSLVTWGHQDGFRGEVEQGIA